MSDAERILLAKDRLHYVDISVALCSDREQIRHAVEKLKIALYGTDPEQEIQDYDIIRSKAVGAMCALRDGATRGGAA